VIRYRITRLVATVLVRSWLRVRIDGLERLPPGPAIYAFNHLSWLDPFVLLAALPTHPRLYLFGPREDDMSVGGRNRLITWSGTAIPYRPGKQDLRVATRRVGQVIDAGAVVAIAGEGRIGADESALLPLSDGPAYFAARSGVPLVPIAINGTSWIRLGGTVRLRVGAPISVVREPGRSGVPTATRDLEAALLALIADAPAVGQPGRVGQWLTERFNDWPEGSREAAVEAARAAATAGPSAAVEATPDD
jgi:1-acyl-sn-glycerol-3-phosphate acyltransferase